MQENENKRLARRWFEEVINQGKVELIDELTDAGYVEHELTVPDLPKGKEGLRALIELYRSAFPDVKTTVEDILAEGDRTVVRTRWQGTHKGEFQGLQPTGKKFDAQSIDILRWRNGKTVEHWGVTDQLAMMQQLGTVPTQ